MLMSANQQLIISFVHTYTRMEQASVRAHNCNDAKGSINIRWPSGQLVDATVNMHIEVIIMRYFMVLQLLFLYFEVAYTYNYRTGKAKITIVK